MLGNNLEIRSFLYVHVGDSLQRSTLGGPKLGQPTNSMGEAGLCFLGAVTRGPGSLSTVWC